MSTPNLDAPFILKPGDVMVTHGVFEYECPTCAKRFRYDDRYEPMCTGPSETRDDHAPTVMRLRQRVARKVMV